METRRPVITGALCDRNISNANAVPLISFDSALHVSCGLHNVHMRGCSRVIAFLRPNCRGLFLLLEAPVCGSKHLMCVSALFQVGVLIQHTD